MEKKRKMLTIGQFAALHGINKKTLMWYDEIGLFRPAMIHPENGYRYYSYYQSSILETILLLRELNVSIDEIQVFMKDRSAESLEQLLREKIEDLDRDMAYLKAVRKKLSYHCQNMATLLTMDLSEISIVPKKESCLVTVAIDKDTTLQKAGEEDAELLHAMQVEAFRELLDRYQDYDTNPAGETVEKVLFRLKQEFTYFYFICLNGRKAGAVRVVDRKEAGGNKRISPIFVLPEFQGKGIAQEAIRLCEALHGNGHWELSTILQEKRNCYLYEKMGYHKTGETKTVNERMTLVFYEK